MTDLPVEHPKSMERGGKKERDLIDPYRGPSDRSSKSETCAGSYIECLEHFDHMN